MKNLTLKKLESLSPCEAGLLWYKNQKEKDVYKICAALINENNASWANWLLARLLNRKNKIKWAIYAAESVLDIFEKKYPADKRPREAIKAAKKALKSLSKENKAAAYAADAAHAAADAAYADAAHAAAAADAAHAAAAHAAAAAADAAHAAAAAAYADAADAAHAAAAAAYADAADAAHAAAYAAAADDAAQKQLRIKLVKYAYGLLLKQREAKK